MILSESNVRAEKKLDHTCNMKHNTEKNATWAERISENVFISVQRSKWGQEPEGHRNRKVHKNIEEVERIAEKRNKTGQKRKSRKQAVTGVSSLQYMSVPSPPPHPVFISIHPYLQWVEDCHPPPSLHPWNIWGSVPGHGSPPLPGDKMEREGIRLTVRCVTRSCVNEKQVEAPHSSLRPRLTTPQGRGAFIVQWKKGGRRARERENRCLKVHETRPSLISQLSIRLSIECPRFPKNTHRQASCALCHKQYNILTLTKLSVPLWTPRFFTVIYSSTLVKENLCWCNKAKTAHYLFMSLHVFQVFIFVSRANLWITAMSVCLLYWKKATLFHLSYDFSFNRLGGTELRNLKRFIFGNIPRGDLAKLTELLNSFHCINNRNMS